jgi:hypothetical protein
MYDVFLAHNSIDKPSVRQLAQALIDKGFRPFLDEEDLLPDERINDQLQKAMRDSLVVAICFGQQIGPVHRHEADTALTANMHTGKSLVTILLPGADESLRPDFLRGFAPISFSSSMDERKPLDKLAETIQRRKQASNVGVDKSKPEGPTTPPGVKADPQDGVQDAIRNLKRYARENGLNFLVGPLTGVEPSEQTNDGADLGDPGPYEMAKAFMGDFDLDRTAGTLLPLETIASWCWIKRGGNSRAFEDDLRRILARRRPAGVKFYWEFAKLLKILSDRPSRAKRDLRPMVFTTNLGTSLEREMIRASVSFSRIVVRLPDKLDVKRFRVEDKGTRISLLDRNDDDRLLGNFDKSDVDLALNAIEDDAVSVTRDAKAGSDPQHLSFDNMEGCIVFKYHGSIDVPGSCIITSDQLFELTREGSIVPNAVITRLQQNPSIVFGTSILLGQVQQMLRAVLWDAFRSSADGRYVVPRSRQIDWMHRLEESLRPNVRDIVSRLGLQEITGGQRNFVENLIKALENDHG